MATRLAAARSLASLHVRAYSRGVLLPVFMQVFRLWTCWSIYLKSSRLAPMVSSRARSGRFICWLFWLLFCIGQLPLTHGALRGSWAARAIMIISVWFILF